MSGKKKLPVKVKKPRGRGRRFEVGNPWRWPKGVSGNPGAKFKRVSDSYREALELVDEKTGLTFAQLLARENLRRAIEGNERLSVEIRQATEGQTMNFAKMTDAELIEFITGTASGDGGGEASRFVDSKTG